MIHYNYQIYTTNVVTAAQPLKHYYIYLKFVVASAINTDDVGTQHCNVIVRPRKSSLGVMNRDGCL